MPDYQVLYLENASGQRYFHLCSSSAPIGQCLDEALAHPERLFSSLPSSVILRPCDNQKFLAKGAACVNLPTITTSTTSTTLPNQTTTPPTTTPLAPLFVSELNCANGLLTLGVRGELGSLDTVNSFSLLPTSSDLIDFSNFPTQTIPNDFMLSNGVIQVGFNKAFGGSIQYFSEVGSTDNLVNNPVLEDGRDETGRQWQTSIYMDPEGYHPSGSTHHGQYPDMVYNGLEGGDAWHDANSPSEWVAYGQQNKFINGATRDVRYLKVRGKLWSVKNIPSDIYFEKWVWLEGKVVCVQQKIIIGRQDNYTGSFRPLPQEMPCLYLRGDFKQGRNYLGNAPFTGQAMTNVNYTTAEAQTVDSYSTEIAMLTNGTRYVGLMVPDYNRFRWQYFGDPSHTSFNNDSEDSAYLAAVPREHWSMHDSKTWSYKIIYGSSESEVRQLAANQPRAAKLPRFIFNTADNTHQDWITYFCNDKGVTSEGWRITNFDSSSFNGDGTNINGPFQSYNASAAPKLYINTKGSGSITSLRVYFAKAGQDYDTVNSPLGTNQYVEVPFVTGSSFNTYEVNMTSNLDYNSLISRVWVRYVGNSRQDVTVKYISYLNESEGGGGASNQLEFSFNGGQSWTVSNTYILPEVQRNGTTLILAARRGEVSSTITHLTNCPVVSTTTTLPVAPTWLAGAAFKWDTVSHGLNVYSTITGPGIPQLKIEASDGRLISQTPQHSPAWQTGVFYTQEATTDFGYEFKTRFYPNVQGVNGITEGNYIITYKLGNETVSRTITPNSNDLIVVNLSGSAGATTTTTSAVTTTTVQVSASNDWIGDYSQLWVRQSLAGIFGSEVSTDKPYWIGGLSANYASASYDVAFKDTRDYVSRYRSYGDELNTFTGIVPLISYHTWLNKNLTEKSHDQMTNTVTRIRAKKCWLMPFLHLGGEFFNEDQNFLYWDKKYNMRRSDTGGYAMMGDGQVSFAYEAMDDTVSSDSPYFVVKKLFESTVDFFINEINDGTCIGICVVPGASTHEIRYDIDNNNAGDSGWVADHSTYAQTGFRQWLQASFSNIGNLNTFLTQGGDFANASTFASFNNVSLTRGFGKSNATWLDMLSFTYKHLRTKRFMDTCYAIIDARLVHHGVSSTIRNNFIKNFDYGQPLGGQTVNTNVVLWKQIGSAGNMYQENPGPNDEWERVTDLLKPTGKLVWGETDGPFTSIMMQQELEGGRTLKQAATDFFRTGGHVFGLRNVLDNIGINPSREVYLSAAIRALNIANEITGIVPGISYSGSVSYNASTALKNRGYWSDVQQSWGTASGGSRDVRIQVIPVDDLTTRYSFATPVYTP